MLAFVIVGNQEGNALVMRWAERELKASDLRCSEQKNVGWYRVVFSFKRVESVHDRNIKD